MDFMGFLVNQGIIIAAGLYVIGIFIKKTPIVPDWLIPFILVSLGIAAAGFSMDGGFNVNNILQGIFAAGAAVLANQMQKQASMQDVGEAFSKKIEKSENRPMDNEDIDAGTEENGDEKNGGD